VRCSDFEPQPLHISIWSSWTEENGLLDEICCLEKLNFIPSVGVRHESFSTEFEGDVLVRAPTPKSMRGSRESVAKIRVKLVILDPRLSMSIFREYVGFWPSSLHLDNCPWGNIRIHLGGRIILNSDWTIMIYWSRLQSSRI